MAQAQRAEGADDEQQTTSFSNKPVVLADNGHGTKVKLWNNDGKKGEYQTVTIERSFKREGSDQWETQKVSLTNCRRSGPIHRFQANALFEQESSVF
jgi:hypothetical protein